MPGVSEGHPDFVPVLRTQAESCNAWSRGTGWAPQPASGSSLNPMTESERGGGGGDRRRLWSLLALGESRWPTSPHNSLHSGREMLALSIECG